MRQMDASQDFQAIEPYSLHGPAEQRVAFVFNSPHSGRHYPARFMAMTRLDHRMIRRSEDCHVDLLFGHVTQLGAPLLAANFPRAYLDANREAFELDPRMYADRLPAHVNQRSARVIGGLGTVPRIVSDGVDIYAGKLPVSEALGRIEHVYKPYHHALRRLLLSTHARFGLAILIDCHSMPGSVRVPGMAGTPDFIIGDRFGSSASSALADHAIGLLKAMGYSVAYNKPYAGGFITEHYGRPGRGLHALQIEINRALYMDEASYEPTAGFGRLREDLRAFCADLVSIPESWLLPGSIAAE